MLKLKLNLPCTASLANHRLTSVVIKDLIGKAKDLTTEAKAKVLIAKAKAKDLSVEAKAKDLMPRPRLRPRCSRPRSWFVSEFILRVLQSL